MKKLFRNPALVIAALALFIALGGGAAVAGTLISGKQIENHSVALSKLTHRAIHRLRGHKGATGEKGATKRALPELLAQLEQLEPLALPAHRGRRVIPEPRATPA